MAQITMSGGRVVMRCGQVAAGEECCCEMPCEISLSLTGVPLVYSYKADLPAGLNVKFDNTDPIMACTPAPDYFIRAYGQYVALANSDFPGYGQLAQPDESVSLSLEVSGCDSWTYRGNMTRGITISGGVGFETLDCGGQEDQAVNVTIEKVIVDDAINMLATIDLPSTFWGDQMLASFLHAERLVGGEQPADFDQFDQNAGQCVLDQLDDIAGRRIAKMCPTDLLNRTYPMQLMLAYTGFIYQPGNNLVHAPPPNSCETSQGLVYISGIDVALSYPP